MIEQSNKIPLVVIVGPTASGKTKLAVELAKSFNGEIVSADSMQIYRHMDIATAKPIVEEMSGIPHHLIDFVEVDQQFSVADYSKLAHEAIKSIVSRNKLPILAGGTGLYINAVVDNIQYAEIKSDLSIRKELQSLAEEKGNEYLLNELNKIDPILAKTLHPNNSGRILRALEVYQITGIPMSEHQRKSRLKDSPYQLCMLGICFEDRELLYQRINQRVDLMMDHGLIEEAKKINQIYQGTAQQAIGYKELQPYFDGTKSLDECILSLKQATRRYAKRQLTWFRRDKRICWLKADEYLDYECMIKAAKNIIHNSGIL